MTRFALRADVHSFLEHFSAAARSGDVSVQRELWAETFLSIDPVGVTTVTRAAMLAALTRRRELFESIGATASELVEAEETPLDDRHTIVRTSWQWRLSSAGDVDEELVLRSTFLLRREESGWMIVLYLNHQDVAALVAERVAPRKG